MDDSRIPPRFATRRLGKRYAQCRPLRFHTAEDAQPPGSCVDSAEWECPAT